MRRNLYIVFLMCLAHFAIAGGGWPQPKGQGFFKVGHWWLIANRHFTNTGMVDPNVTAGLYTTFFYGEYGITERLTSIVYAPLFTRATINHVYSKTTGNQISEGDALNSIGDWNVSLKYGLITDKRFVVSTSLTLGLPFGNPMGGKEGNLQTGDGEFNQMLRIDASHGNKIGKMPVYFSFYTGINNRTNNFSDEIRYGVEGGMAFLNSKLYLILRINGIKSLLNGNTDNPVSTTVFANNSEFLSFQPEVLYNFNKNFGVSVSQGTAIFGKLIYANPTYSVGIHYNLK